VVLLVATGVSAFAYRAALINRDQTDYVDHTYTVIQNINDALLTADDLESQYQDFLLAGSAAALAAYNLDLDHTHVQLAGLDELTADSPDQADRWHAIQAKIDALHNNTLLPVIALKEQAAAGQASDAQVIAAARGGNAQRGFLEVHIAFAVAQRAEYQLLAQRTQRAADEEANLTRVLMMGSLVTITIGLTCAALLSASVGQAMKRLAVVAQAIAAGDLSQRIALKRTDEIGLAAEAFDAMASTLQRDIEERAHAQAETESILNAAAEGVYSIDQHGYITMLNPAGERMTGYSRQEAIGKRLHSLLHHSYKDGSPYPVEACPARVAIHDGEMRHVRGEVFWRKDGTSFPVDYTAVPIKTDGALSGAVVTFHDITQVLANDRMKDEFVSVVSHELRTPLTSIRGSLGLLAAGLLGPVPERANRMVEVALNNTDRLIRLVSDILDIERIESGKVAMELRLEDARELVQRSVESINNVAEAAGVKLVSEAESIPLMVDPDRVLQTLTNLLSNAIKFSEPGREVAVEVRRQNGSAVFAVRDEGRGIPADKLDSIFRRFVQVDASDARQKGGTGLGLAIARSIVQQHGGEIWVESVVGEGSTFYFTVPVRADSDRSN